MTVVQQIKQSAKAGVCVVQTPNALSNLFVPDCAAAIWERQPLPSFQFWLDNLDPQHLPSARLILRATAVQDAMRHRFRLSGAPDCPERAILIDDIAALADIFASLMDTAYLHLRLHVISTDACHTLHEDAVTARLICTYRGTGTQYGVSSNVGDPDYVHTLPTCAPIVLRGADWPTRPRTILRYRSPSIEGTGETRLVLMLDPVADPEGTRQIQSMTRH
ncbi:MAG: DUF1826 domain-containing protein [Pseudomonadota bacterium]